jgi:hypothetical protein
VAVDFALVPERAGPHALEERYARGGLAVSYMPGRFSNATMLRFKHLPSVQAYYEACAASRACRTVKEATARGLTGKHLESLRCKAWFDIYGPAKFGSGGDKTTITIGLTRGNLVKVAWANIVQIFKPGT